MAAAAVVMAAICVRARTSERHVPAVAQRNADLWRPLFNMADRSVTEHLGERRLGFLHQVIQLVDVGLQMTPERAMASARGFENHLVDVACLSGDFSNLTCQSS